ncbi:uncharacterized protein [Solanum lycopersicum]|uniref:uncharacterized protein n=1 Tax=Solanum lycopersicum TaxID=4081 RepID=UPI000532F7A2|nr:uncharacterized protein LOC104649722 [Solanum lycopersicum]
MDKICDLFSFKQRNSSMYYAAANGLAEAFNKTLCNLFNKVISKSKRNWHDRMGEALWAYRMTHRMPNQATPYSLIFRTEAVLPLERQLPSLRLAIKEGLTEEDNARPSLEDLEALDENRLESQQSLEFYQAHLSCAFNKKIEDIEVILPTKKEAHYSDTPTLCTNFLLHVRKAEDIERFKHADFDSTSNIDL